MRIILDTNLYISALINRNSRQRLNRIFDDPSIVILIDEVLLAEIDTVTLRPKISKYLTSSERTAFMQYVKGRCLQVSVSSVVAVSPDPDDDFLLALAKDGQAGYLITGNKRDLLDLNEFNETKIVTLTGFLELLP